MSEHDGDVNELARGEWVGEWTVLTLVIPHAILDIFYGIMFVNSKSVFPTFSICKYHRGGPDKSL